MGIIAYGLVLLVLVVFVEVIARYVFNAPFVWAFELSMYLYGSITVLIGGYTVLHRAQIRMDIIYSRFSPRRRAVVDVLTSLLFFLYIIVLILSTGQFAIKSVLENQHSNSLWGPPMYPLKIVMVIAALLVLIQGLAEFIRNLYHAWTGRTLT